MNKAIVYYTNNKANGTVIEHCFAQLLSVRGDIPMYITAQQPMTAVKELSNVEFRLVSALLPKTLRSVSYQMLEGCKIAAGADLIFFCEHDVFYPEGYFDWEPENKEPHRTQYYNSNIIFACNRGYFRRGTDRLPNVIGPCSMGAGFRGPLIHVLEDRIIWHDKNPEVNKILYSEIGNSKHEKNLGWTVAARGTPTELPALDIQHGDNYTRHKLSRRICKFYKDDATWGNFDELWERLRLEKRGANK